MRCGKVYLFKGHKYLRWDIATDTREHEAVIADGWPGLADAVASTGSFADGIDAAVNWAAPFVLRSQWGASAPTSRTVVPIVNRTEFIVHYSTGQELGREDTCAWVKSIQQDHMTNRGWADIGYNFLVDRFGNVFEGRGRDIEGAHCPGHNTSGIGVCFLGNDDPKYEDATPHARAQIRNLWRRFSNDAGHELARHGHRDFKSTQCPGDELYAWATGGMPLP